MLVIKDTVPEKTRSLGNTFNSPLV